MKKELIKELLELWSEYKDRKFKDRIFADEGPDLSFEDFMDWLKRENKD